MNISILGHAAFSTYHVNIDGAYRESNFPIGPMLLQLALNPSAANINSVDDLDVVAEKYRRNFYALEQFRYHGGREYYAIERYLGSRKAPDSSNDIIRFQSQSDDDAPPHLVLWDMGFGGLEIANPGPDVYESVLWASGAAMPDKTQFVQIADKCFLCLDADVLRRAGAMISRQLSWERTVTELIDQLQVNKDIAYLMQARYILLLFAEDGAVYINNTGDVPQIQLILTHGGCEGSLREQIQGDFDNLFSVATLSLAMSMMQANNSFNAPLEPQIVSSIMQTAEGIMMTGFSFDDDEKGISLTINHVNKNWPAFDVPLINDEWGLRADANWTIANNVTDSTALFDVAANYVTQGAKVIDGLPQLNFGALTTIDRWEIEAYQDIRNLIISYAHSEESKPLSIAVFGTPGSGKSFGVTQIAQNIMPGRIEKLEFNVSQFTNATDLGNSFQKVRDAIVMGKLPLVFFDEFDSERDGTALGWIKSFLMPMQDGKFKDESGEHPLRR